MGIVESICCGEKKVDDRKIKYPNLWFDEEGNPKKPQQTLIALCFAYLGTEYHGLSLHNDDKTVILDLQEAMVNLGIISPLKTRVSLKWSESSRTDAGVHAAAQVVSLQVALPDGVKVKNLPGLIQEQLGSNSNIRIWAAVSPGTVFNAQQSASSRRYFYLMPLDTFKESSKSHLDYLRNEVCQLFVGKHQFVNYTRHITDENIQSSIKIIRDFSFSDPFEINGTKYVLFIIYGNSFMLNQIRKMIATVLSASYNLLTIEQIKETLTETRWALPRLIGLGLFLDQVYFESSKIIKKFGNEVPKKRDIHFTFVRSEIEQWKKEILFQHIDSIVKKENPFRKWVNEVLLQHPPVYLKDSQLSHKEKNSDSLII